MAMIYAVCRVCHLSTVVGDRLPASCDRCESPFFWYKRVSYKYVLTEEDRAFLRAGGISPEDPTPATAEGPPPQNP
jgi:hypothetical protein